MTKPVLIMNGPLKPDVSPDLDAAFAVTRPWLTGNPDKAIAEAAPNCVAFCSAGTAQVSAKLMATMPKLRIVGHWGVGYDAVDAEWAGRNGIIVTHTPDVLSDEVADTTIGLLLMTVRELGKAEAWMRGGHWSKTGAYRLTPASLRDRRIGIVGLGRIGRAIGRRLEGFGVPIAYHSRKQQAGAPYPYYASLVEMAKACDTLIVITPGGAATKNLINAEVLQALGSNGILINMARGSVVDEPALLAALKSGTILAAGLDVFWNEPHVNPEFLTLENAVVLPHVASASVHTRTLMARLVVDNLKAFAAGKPPLTPVPETPFKGW